ncbi:MAG: hypothetical protein AB9922_11665 [Bacteroidales bacterium]
METVTINQKMRKNSSAKEISDYFLEIILNLKGDSAKINERANNVFINMEDHEKLQLMNALNNINNRM